MRFFLVSLLFLSVSVVYPQVKAPGVYRDHFGSQLSLNTNGTFIFHWQFDLSVRWTKGTWSYYRDTIYLVKIAVLDTLEINDNNGSIHDSLILSVDNNDERLTKRQLVEKGLSSGMQDLSFFPDTLYPRRSKLFQIHNRRRVTKRHRGITPGKKWKPGYIKADP